MTPSNRALVLLALLLVPSLARADAVGDEDIRRHVERILPAWNAHDMKAFARLFAEDADFVNVIGVWWKSRGEIEAAHEATHRTMFKDSRLSGGVASLKRVGPEVAVAHFAWSLLGSTTPDGQKLPERRGILVFVLTGHADGWIIRAAQNTDIVALPAVPPGR